MLTFAVMLIVALVIATLVARVRQQTRVAGARERRTALLYAMSRELAATRDSDSMARLAVKHVAEVFECECVVLLPDGAGRLRYPAETPMDGSYRGADLAVAQWVADHGRRAGLGSDTLPAAPALYLPLGEGREGLGVLTVRPRNPRRVLLPEQRHLLETFAGQIGLALERAGLAETAAGARIAAERETLRNTLLASISHDLRTPLAAMAGAASTLVTRGAALDDATRTELARSIESRSRDMSELVSKVLDLMRFDSGEITLRRDWEAVEDLVGAALEHSEHRLGEHRVEVALPADLPLVFVDATLVVQVFANLFDNAAKYTPAGTTDHGHRARRRRGRARHGRRQRARVAARRSGAPVRQVPARHSGRHDRRRRARAIDLPRDRPRARRHDRGRSAARRRRATRVHVAHDGAGSVTDAMHQVLVVEDDDGIRNVLRVLLEGENYRIVEATTAQRAEIEARSHKPDLLLVDLGLPDGDGLDVIKRVRAWSPVPIVVLSARTLEAQKIAALDAGADDYVTKPFSAPELLARVRASLRRNVRGTERIATSSHRGGRHRSRSPARGPAGEIHLTPLEYRVLECLVRHSGRIVRPQQLLRESWGPDKSGDTRTLRVCIKNLRDKLEPDPRRPRFLVTEVGLGYRLIVPDASGIRRGEPRSTEPRRSHAGIADRHSPAARPRKNSHRANARAHSVLGVLTGVAKACADGTCVENYRPSAAISSSRSSGAAADW